MSDEIPTESSGLKPYAMSKAHLEISGLTFIVGIEATRFEWLIR